MFVPGLNLSSLTADQLIDKMTELTKKIAFMSYSNNGSSDMMMSMLEAVRLEYQERQFMESWKLSANAASRTIETEPDLQKDSKQEEAAAKKNSEQKRRREIVMTRTNKPVIPDKDDRVK